jgi:transcriptional regulator with XRE-family HTH domain
MESQVGSSIKKYRKICDLTQERLAEYLNVSHQAVSKWESGEVYPDVEFFPRIASIFHITIDMLFNYKLKDEDDKINDVLSKIESFGNSNNLVDAEKECRNGLLKFPTSYHLMERLATILKTRYLSEQSNDTKILKEAIEKCEIVISECRDEKVLLIAYKTMAICYAYLGEEQKALDIANSTPVNYDNVKIYILKGDAKIDECKKDIDVFTEMIKKRLKLIGKVLKNQANDSSADLYFNLSENFSNPIILKKY